MARSRLAFAREPRAEGMRHFQRGRDRVGRWSAGSGEGVGQGARGRMDGVANVGWSGRGGKRVGRGGVHAVEIRVEERVGGRGEGLNGREGESMVYCACNFGFSGDRLPLRDWDSEMRKAISSAQEFSKTEVVNLLLDPRARLRMARVADGESLKASMKRAEYSSTVDAW